MPLGMPCEKEVWTDNIYINVTEIKGHLNILKESTFSWHECTLVYFNVKLKVLLYILND